MENSRKILVLFLTAILFFSLCGCGGITSRDHAEISTSPEAHNSIPVMLAAETQLGFSDVSPDDWYAAAVQYVLGRGLMVGTSDHTFSPDGTFTRAQLATVLYRIAGEPSVDGVDSFADTEPGTWYSDAVLWAEGSGVVNGIGGGLFGTNNSVTQEQLITMLWRIEDKPDAAAASDASEYAAKAVSWARGAGIAPETADYTFAPKEYATRAQVAVLLQGYLAWDSAQRTETMLLPSEPGYNFFSGYLKGAGRAEKGYNGEEFIHSEAADKIFRDLYYSATFGLANQEDPAIYAYWESLGLRKTIYDADDADRMWSVFVPASDRFDKNYRFPVVFCLHGHNNNILLAETYGFAKLGGSEGFITVVPWAKDEDIIVEEIPRILETLRRENYPMDERRIYAAGFSKGGMAAQTVALAYSDVFAAVAPGGCGTLGTDANAAPIRSGSLGWSFRPEAFESAYPMPVLFFGGSCDSMPIDTASVKDWIDLAQANAPEMTASWFSGDASASKNDVERFTGLQYQAEAQMEIRQYDGQNYYIGSYYNPDGICTFRAVSVEGAPHWPMPSEANVVWEFFSQFARDPESHKLMYLSAGEPSSTAPAPSSALSEVEISLTFTRATTHASNQIAIWVEDEAGKLVKTIYVSDFTAARRGYKRREDALSHWVAAAAPSNMSDAEIDAVSGATPIAGRRSYFWDMTDTDGNAVPDGTYRIMVEGTLYWGSNVVYSAELSTISSEGGLEVTEIRSEPYTHENENMLSQVEVIAKK